jgi:hypothetical protein
MLSRHQQYLGFAGCFETDSEQMIKYNNMCPYRETGRASHPGHTRISPVNYE